MWPHKYQASPMSSGCAGCGLGEGAEVHQATPRLAEIEFALGDAWDDGNACGLDGWVGPGRGTEPDDYAIRRRERFIAKKLALGGGVS